MFYVVSSISRMSEKRNMLYICATREAFREYFISHIMFVLSEWIVADSFTNIMSQPVIRQVPSTRKIHVQPDQ